MNKILSSKNIKRAVFAVFLFQFLYIVFLNLFKCHAWIDHDASMLYSHTIHMWEQKKFVIPFYQEETFLHIDTSCLFAMPLYGLTHDIFLAYGISNVIFLVLTIGAMYDLLKKFDVDDSYRYAAMLLYLIPYRIGLVNYTTMLFFECSFYNVCILVTVLCIDLFLTPDERSKGLKYLGKLVIFAFFTALTAFSRGTYTLLVALCPIIFCYVLEVILSEDGLKHIRRSKLIVTAVTVLSYAAGMGLGRLIGAKPNVEGYSLVLPRDIFDNFKKVFWGHLSIYMDRITPGVFTAGGIRALIMFASAIFTLIILIFNLKHAFRDEKYSNVLRYLTIVYLWNVCVLGLTNCSPSDIAFSERYLFPGFIPLVLSLPVMLTYLMETKRDLLRQSLYLAIAVLIGASAFVSDIGILGSFKTNAEETQGIKEVIAYARENGFDTVYFLNDDNAGLISRSLDPTLKVVSIETHDDGTYTLKARENYMCAHDRAYYSDENLMAVTWNARPEDVLPEYMLSSYQNATDVRDYHLYTAGTNKFDDRSGFPLNDRIMNESIDYCHTEGYQIAGDIDLYGYLETTGSDNYVLISPELDAPYTTCDVILRYEMGYKTAESPKAPSDKTRSVGTLRLLDSSLQPVAETDMKSDEDKTVLSVSPDSGSPCYIAVWLNSDEAVTLCDLTFAVRP